jgi:hypothetical protein
MSKPATLSARALRYIVIVVAGLIGSGVAVWVGDTVLVLGAQLALDPSHPGLTLSEQYGRNGVAIVVALFVLGYGAGIAAGGMVGSLVQWVVLRDPRERGTGLVLLCAVRTIVVGLAVVLSIGWTALSREGQDRQMVGGFWLLGWVGAQAIIDLGYDRIAAWHRSRYGRGDVPPN